MFENIADTLVATTSCRRFGTVFRSITSAPSLHIFCSRSNSVTRNYCCRALEVTLSFMDTLIALTYLLILERSFHAQDLPRR